VAYADTRPLVPPLSPEEDALNRRVEFYFHRPEVMSYQVVM
jgi:chemotaxis protein MotB